MTYIKLFLSPRGRISAATFWRGWFILSAVSIAVLFIPRVGVWLWLASFVPWTVLTAKRLHDINLSGWVQIAPYLVNLAIFLAGLVLLGTSVYLTLIKREIVQAQLDAGAAAGVGGGLLLTAGFIAFNAVWLVWLGSRPGSPDVNRYGRPTHWTVDDEDEDE